MIENTEVLRSGWMIDGTRIFLEFQKDKEIYQINTRWARLTFFGSIEDACDAFEAMELADGEAKPLALAIKKEIARVGRHEFGKSRSTHGRINYLVRSAERRLAGLRPIRHGSKGSVEAWIPSRKKEMV